MSHMLTKTAFFDKKNAVKRERFWNLITIQNTVTDYSCDEFSEFELNFLQPLLQSLMSHDPSKIIIIC